MRTPSVQAGRVSITLFLGLIFLGGGLILFLLGFPLWIVLLSGFLALGSLFGLGCFLLQLHLRGKKHMQEDMRVSDQENFSIIDDKYIVQEQIDFGNYHAILKAIYEQRGIRIVIIKEPLEEELGTMFKTHLQEHCIALQLDKKNPLEAACVLDTSYNEPGKMIQVSQKQNAFPIIPEAPANTKSWSLGKLWSIPGWIGEKINSYMKEDLYEDPTLILEPIVSPAPEPVWQPHLTYQQRIESFQVFDFWEVLEVDKNLDLEKDVDRAVIKSAYRNLGLKFHIDKNQQIDPDLEREYNHQFSMATHARDALLTSTPLQRKNLAIVSWHAKYDRAKLQRVADRKKALAEKDKRNEELRKEIMELREEEMKIKARKKELKEENKSLKQQLKDEQKLTKQLKKEIKKRRNEEQYNHIKATVNKWLKAVFRIDHTDFVNSLNHSTVRNSDISAANDTVSGETENTEQNYKKFDTSNCINNPYDFFFPPNNHNNSDNISHVNFTPCDDTVNGTEKVIENKTVENQISEDDEQEEQCQSSSRTENYGNANLQDRARNHFNFNNRVNNNNNNDENDPIYDIDKLFNPFLSLF